MPSKRQRILLLGFYGLALLSAALVLGKFAPEQYGFYPKCSLFSLTGLQCPGCGGLRATHQLLHGELLSAWRLNPLVFIVLPTLFALLGAHVYWVFTGRSWATPLLSPFWLWSVAGVSVFFGLLRNFL